MIFIWHTKLYESNVYIVEILHYMRICPCRRISGLIRTMHRRDPLTMMTEVPDNSRMQEYNPGMKILGNISILGETKDPHLHFNG